MMFAPQTSKLFISTLKKNEKTFLTVFVGYLTEGVTYFMSLGHLFLVLSTKMLF